MTSTYIRSQLSCLSAIVMPERAWGVCAYDGELPAALRVAIAIDLGSWKAEWEPERVLVDKTFEGSACEGSAFVGRILRGSFSVTPVVQNIKLVAIWGLNLFAPFKALPWADEAPSSREPDTDGEIGSWGVDYLAKPSAGQAVRYMGILFDSVTVEASRQQPALRYSFTFAAKDRNEDFYTSPHALTFDEDEAEGNPFLFKNAAFYIGDLRVECESFRLTVTNPIAFDGFDEDGLANGYGMGSQQAECEVVFALTEEIFDQVDGWMTDPDFEADIRAQFVHPSAVRHLCRFALNRGAGFIPLSPEDVGSPGTPKTDYGRLKDQDIFIIEGTQLDSPLNTTYTEVGKVDGSQGPGGVSPSGLWFQSQPSEGTARYEGLRNGFAANSRILSNAHEIGLFRAFPVRKESFDDGPIRKCRMVFSGCSDGADGGGQLVDALNPALHTSLRP